MTQVSRRSPGGTDHRVSWSVGWAFGPRNLMKSPGWQAKPPAPPGRSWWGRRFRLPFSTLLGWAFGPRNFMKNSGSPRGFPDVQGGFSPLSGARSAPQLTDDENRSSVPQGRLQGSHLKAEFSQPCTVKEQALYQGTASAVPNGCICWALAPGDGKPSAQSPSHPHEKTGAKAL